MRLREVRVHKLQSIRGLARTAGVSDKTIRSVEAGQSRPALSTIRKLSQALEVDPREVDEFREAMERAMGQG